MSGLVQTADTLNLPAIIAERHGYDRPSRRPPLGFILLIIVAVLTVVGMVVGLVVLWPRASVTLSASSTAAGTQSAALLTADFTGERRNTWQSAGGDTVGTTLTMSWNRATTIDRIRLRSPQAASIRSMLLTFDTGGTLMVGLDSHGDASTSFPARSVRSVIATVTTVKAGTSQVGLSAMSIDDEGEAVAMTADGDAAGTAAATASSGAAASLVDGARSLAQGRTGKAWVASAGDTAPWVRLTWPAPHELSSVQLFGAPGRTGEVRSGVLRFSDGTSVAVGGVQAAAAVPSVIGFAPRMTSWVQFDMTGTDVELREFAAYEAGSTPVAVKAASTAADVDVPAASNCDGVTAGSPSTTLRLLCPTTGSAVGGSTMRLVVSAPAHAAVAVRGWEPLPGATTGPAQVIAKGSADGTGTVDLRVPLSRLLNGPVTLSVTSDRTAQPLAVQMVNSGGVAIASSAAPVAPAGRTLLYSDSFNSGSLSVSRLGAGTRYSATKPAATGASEFGQAIFADPAWHTENLGTTAGGYLRLRLSPANGRPDPLGWKRTQLGAILSSASVGGSGVSAQYGYFEARLLGAPGTGTWPAFWMLSTGSLLDGKADSGEVDALETYGHDTGALCQSVHSWIGGKDASPTTKCGSQPQVTDWSMQWHTYGANITPNGVDFTIDGQLVGHENTPAASGEPFYFLLDLASGGGWPVDLSATSGVSDMYVDWVRVYS